jgi:hypothetical protein
MYDRTYQRRRGELQSLGEILHAALQVADPNYYRPEHPFRHGRAASKKKKQPKDDGKLRGVQLEIKFPEAIRDPERPLIDLIPEAYSE